MTQAFNFSASKTVIFKSAWKVSLKGAAEAITLAVISNSARHFESAPN